MSAHLTAALKCWYCGHEWTHDAAPDDPVYSVAAALLKPTCPECTRANPTVIRMRFCSVRADAAPRAEREVVS